MSLWLRELSKPCGARATVVCFPFGGGHSGAYRRWAKLAPSSLRIVGVDPPGRGARFDEPLLDRMERWVDAMLQERQALTRHAPLVFFGHSLGATLAFELARALEASNGPAPLHVIVSGKGAPQLPRRASRISHLPDDDFIREVQRYQGMPAEMMAHRELLELFLPILRADFAVTESYVHRTGAPLRAPLTVLGGTADPMVPPETLEPWREHTTGTFVCRTFEGGHFFINDHAPAILRLFEEAPYRIDPITDIA